MYAVCVNFKIKTDHMTEFLHLMKANAKTSLQSEAACLQFDVLTDPDKSDTVFLYELYLDRAGFEAHLQTAHFRTFDAAVGPMIAAKDVQTWAEVAQ